MPKTIVIFDVDLTISQGILQEALFVAMDPEIKALEYQKGFKGEDTWTKIIDRAIANYPPQNDQIQNYLAGIPLVAGMKQAFDELITHPDTTLAILSGGNKLLVKKYLQIHQCSVFFDEVYASELNYDAQNKCYHYRPIQIKCQLDTCSNCKASAFNLTQLISQYQKVIYVGDGLNDLCGMSIVENGYAFIRKGKELDKKSNKIQGLLDKINVPINYWIDGYHLAQQIRTLF